VNLHSDRELQAEQRGAARWLILNRPRRRNALTVELVGALADELESTDPAATRAVVITGAPPAFCGGGDLTALGEIAERGALAVSEFIYAQFHRTVRAISAARVPVIAAVNGAALGAGLDLAAACDLRYAAESATFASSWINVGLVPGMGGASWLTRIAGATRAAELVLLGQTITAATALDWGLVNAITADDELDDHVASIVTRLEDLPGPAVERSKAALRRARETGLPEELVTLGAVQGSLLTAEDFRAATARFRK
jgi:2-(1,2-epoxy-1,2-dihydrophenyl)acetyl-CoA isomerase